jgi:hypothetical protein
MGQERALAAIERIERSLARLEAAAARPVRPPPPPAHSEPDERLSAAHAGLRFKVEAAIAQIDALLATEEAG